MTYEDIVSDPSVTRTHLTEKKLQKMYQTVWARSFEQKSKAMLNDAGRVISHKLTIQLAVAYNNIQFSELLRRCAFLTGLYINNLI